MFAVIRQRMREEAGISLVEVLVSILLLGLVLAALGSTLTASMAGARQDESQTHATALATETLENLQALPWGKLGFYDNDGPGWTPNALGGLPTVSLGPVPATRDAAVPVPQSTVTRDGRQYVVTTNIVWQDLNKYTRFRVVVTWNDGAQPRTLTLEGRRTRRSRDSGAPGAAVQPYRIEAFTINPDPVALTAAGLTQANTTLDPSGPGLVINVDTNEPSSAVSVTWPGMAAQALTEIAGSGGHRWRALFPPGQTFPHGYTTFTATATKLGAPSTTHVDTTVGYFMYPVALNTASLKWDNNLTRTYTGTPGPAGDRLCVIGNPKYLQNDYPFWVDLTGVGADDHVTLVRTDVVPNITWTFAPTATSGGATFYTLVPRVDDLVNGIPGAGVLDINGTSTWRINWTRSYDGTAGFFDWSMRNKGGSTPC